MLHFLRVRRARKAAIAILAPHVAGSRRRLGEIPDGLWLDPYVVGFVGMLITLIARRASGPLDANAMAMVQTEAWADITGIRAELIGEEIVYLSSIQDRSFAGGCGNARAFLEAHYGEPIEDEMMDRDWTGADGAGVYAGSGEHFAIHAGDDASVLWRLFFDSRLATAQNDYA